MVRGSVGDIFIRRLPLRTDNVWWDAVILKQHIGCYIQGVGYIPTRIYVLNPLMSLGRLRRNHLNGGQGINPKRKENEI